MSHRKTPGLVLVALVFSVALVACGSSDNSQPTKVASEHATPAQQKAIDKFSGKKPPSEKKSSGQSKGSQKQSGASETSPADEGKQLFASMGCATCHTFAAASASGTIGPDLDQELPGKSVAFVKESIEDPDKDITAGYSAGIMPTDFSSRMSAAQINTLANFLVQDAGQ